MLDNPEEAAKLRYKEYYRDVPTVGGLLPESYVCSLAYESYWDRNDGYFDGLWWQDREKLAEAAAMLRLEASRSGGIDIIDVLGRKRLDETNTKMYAIQALANASRSGTWDEQTLIALENSLFSQGRIYNNDTHTLSAADIDALITYEDGIIFREFGNWLEGGGAYIIAGVTMIGMDYFVTHGADRIVDGVYSGGNNDTLNINTESLRYSKSAIHDDRPYQQSTQIIQEIINSGSPTPDPRGTDGLWWKVRGTYNGSSGYYELLITSDKTTIRHFLFIGD